MHNRQSAPGGGPISPAGADEKWWWGGKALPDLGDGEGRAEIVDLSLQPSRRPGGHVSGEEPAFSRESEGGWVGGWVGARGWVGGGGLGG